MVLTKEYRICMPLTTEEYRIGQLYMIARHSLEQSDCDDSIEIVKREVCEDPVHGKGQYTEKRIYLSSKLPSWLRLVIPKIFYITEKAWNYYPFTLTEYTCSFVPKLRILMKTRYIDDNGCTENCLDLSPVELINREVDYVDIAYDEISADQYKEEEDPKYFQSKRTGRGPLIEGWRETMRPIMCSYKLVNVSLEFWQMQGRIEQFIHKFIRDIVLLGHRQAFAWIDEWYDMSLEDVRSYEDRTRIQTNEKLITDENNKNSTPTTPSSPMPTSLIQSTNIV